MNISDVVCYVPPQSTSQSSEQHAVIVIIKTSEGLTGVGEGTLMFPMCLSRQVVSAIMGCKKYLIGKNPSHIERIWADLSDRYFWRGGPVELHALGAINHALWDIAGKKAGMPVYEMFGGAYHEKIPVYHNGWWKGAVTTEEVVEKAIAVVRSGATRIKWYPFSFLPQLQDNYIVSRTDIDRAVNEVIAVRQAVGPGIEIMVDVWRRLDLNAATQFCKRIEEIGLVFVEEAISADNIDSMIKLSSMVGVRLATGERLLTSYEFSQLFEAQAIGIAQINVTRVGGLTEARKIANMAANYGIGVAPHNPTGAIATAAAVHLCANLRNFALLERFIPFDDPWVEENLDYGPDYINLPTKPGIGVTVNEDYLMQYPADY
jgi:galactonate dehydratase